MPYRSDAQRRWMFAAQARGEMPKGTAERWQKYTGKKDLPERVKKEKEAMDRSVAYQLGAAAGMAPKGMEKESAAWAGRNLIMPMLRALAYLPQKGLGAIKKPWAGRASESIGKYRAGLGAAAKSPANIDEHMTKVVAKRRGTPIPHLPTSKHAPPGSKSEYGKIEKALGKFDWKPGGATDPATREALEKALKLQGLYGGIGGAAVGIPAIAGFMGGVSAHRRRKAERELEEAMQDKTANTKSQAYNIGMLAGAGQLMTKKAKGGVGRAMEYVGRKVTRPTAWAAEHLGAKGKEVGKGLREAAGSSATWRGSTAGKRTPLTEPTKGATKKMRRLGTAATVGGAAATGTGAALVGGLGSKKKKKKKESKKEANLGSPVMDGFLICCAENGLNAQQTVNLVEKRAAINDAVGRECKSFLERVAACEE